MPEAQRAGAAARWMVASSATMTATNPPTDYVRAAIVPPPQSAGRGTRLLIGKPSPLGGEGRVRWRRHAPGVRRRVQSLTREPPHPDPLPSGERGIGGPVLGYMRPEPAA